MLCNDQAMNPPAQPHRVAVLALRGVVAFELGLPHRFLAAGSLDPAWPGPPTGPMPYEVSMCTVDDGPVLTSAGFEALPTHPSSVIAEADTIIVPGITGSQVVTRGELPRGLVELAATARPGARWLSICTGAFVLGEAGLLDGRQCTTHWKRTSELAARFPRARVLEDRLFVTDRNVTTSAGIASGIDMALALIEQSDGPMVAAEVAREMVVYLRRDGSQEQHSIYLDYRTHLHPGVHRVQDWIVRHPDRRATLEELGELAGMSSRHLSRTFRGATGISVHEFTTRARVELAKTLVNDPALTMEGVASRAGVTVRELRRLGVRRRDRLPRR
jgi:transcriptional regulator GlxA family with amidase domain